MANAGVLGSITPTRSPGSTPACSSSVATRAAAASNSAKVNCRSSQRSATRLGLRSLDAMRLVLRLVMVYLWNLIGCLVLGGLFLRNTIVLSASSHNNVGGHNNLAASV